ncbi:MAG: hypothetical protein VKL39_23290 [Leptolyngbyaceae bacterium]|nr:hypothetical protein [Leptolyngbyaceae bacterium]
MSVKLVAIGDSLTQGFISGSISKTKWSYPAMIARSLGIQNFKTPDFSGEGGLPFNIEALLHRLSDRYGRRISWLEAVPALLTVRSHMDRVEDYWERDDGSRKSQTGPLHHNLAVWGFQLGDSFRISDAVSQANIPPAEDQLLQQIPEAAQYRTARRTLNPSYDPHYRNLSQIGVAQHLAREHGGIENLIFWLGSNHCLGTVVRLNIKWSTEADLVQLPPERNANLWRPEHFKIILQQTLDQVETIGAENVFIANVPRVTIPPISRGVTPGAAPGQGQDKDGYFEYYTHFWIWDDDFNPERHPHLTREDIRVIDAVVDEYNRMIQEEATRRGWHVVDMCKILSQMAFRRQRGHIQYDYPPELIDALRSNPATSDRITSTGKVLFDTRYIRIDRDKATPQDRYKGGLFSLDGIHPTTIGYGLAAHEFLKVMKSVHGTSQQWQSLDWKAIVANDALAINPPENLANLQDTLGFLYSQTPLGQLVAMIAGFGEQGT